MLTPDQTVLAIRMLSRNSWGPVSTRSFHLSPCVCGVPMWQQPCNVCDYYPSHYLPSNDSRASNERMAEACRERVSDPRAAFKKAIEKSGDEELGYEGNLATFYLHGYRSTCAWNPSAREGDARGQFWADSHRRLTAEQAKFREDLQALAVKASRIDCASADDLFDTVIEHDRSLPMYYGEHFGLARIVEGDWTTGSANFDVHDMKALNKLVGHELIQSLDDFTLTSKGEEVHRIYAFERLPRG